MAPPLTPEEQLGIFGTHRLDEYARQAGEGWGKTEAWKESQRRTATYTKDDWRQIKREADTNIGALGEAIRAGEPATGQVAMDLAEAHRGQTTRRFYDCSYDRHRALAELLRVRPARPSSPGRTSRRASRTTSTTPSWPTRSGARRTGRSRREPKN